RRKLVHFVVPEAILPDLRAGTKEEAAREMVDVLHPGGYIDESDREDVVQAIPTSRCRRARRAAGGERRSSGPMGRGPSTRTRGRTDDRSVTCPNQRDGAGAPAVFSAPPSPNPAKPEPNRIRIRILVRLIETRS